MLKLIEEFKNYLPKEEKLSDEIVEVNVGDIDIENLGYSDSEKEAKRYLESLNEVELYSILSAWDIGRSLITNPHSLYEDVEHFGGKDNLFNENIRILKGNIPVKSEAISYLLGKQGPWVVKCLNKFKDEFL